MGPTAEILLPHVATRRDREIVSATAKILDASTSTAREFSVKDTTAIGGTTRGRDGARPFSTTFAKPECDGDEAEALRRAFGFLPAASLQIAAHCNRAIDHRMLGELVRYLCERLDGIISFGGDIGVDERAYQGLIVIGGGHYSDLKFFRRWLNHPDFHMIK